MPTDSERLDWLTKPDATDRHVYQCANGEWCAQEDVIGAWHGATPREAIDKAMEAMETPDWAAYFTACQK